MSTFMLLLGLLMDIPVGVLASVQTSGIGSQALASMPIREVTIFKDGHAFVAHTGEVPTDAEGDVVLDYLPTPVIGTFWPYADDPRARLESVSAGQQRVTLEKTAMSIPDLLAANDGSQIEVREGDEVYRGTIVGLPKASAEELEASSPAGSGPRLPQSGQVILLKTDRGTRVIPLERIQDVTFLNEMEGKLPYEEIRHLLRLKLDWGGKEPGKSARVGMTYLQKGLRWIPHYKLHLNGDGTVKVQLQATILNELADLENVTANLLVGVPTFAFKSTIDPIALQQTMAQLSTYFQEHSQTSNAFSNSIMMQTQVARMGESRRAGQEASDPGAEVASSGRNEEMYVFTLKGVSLNKGERMVLPVGEWTLPYRDIFRVELPFAPPLEVRQSFNSSQEAELAKLFHAPKVQHVLRLNNNQSVPLTTAPALIVSDKGALGQGMMTYTSPGASVDLTVTTAINVPVSLEEEETRRTPEALTWRQHSYMQIDMRGTVKLSNYREGPIDIEVVRTIMGVVESVEEQGKVKRPGAWEQALTDRPDWWNWYSWPYWWTHMNAFSHIEWKQKLAPGETVELPYTWHYYWTY